MVFFLNFLVFWCAFIARELICVDAVLVGVRNWMICVKVESSPLHIKFCLWLLFHVLFVYVLGFSLFIVFCL